MSEKDWRVLRKEVLGLCILVLAGVGAFHLCRIAYGAMVDDVTEKVVARAKCEMDDRYCSLIRFQ